MAGAAEAAGLAAGATRGGEVVTIETGVVSGAAGPARRRATATVVGVGGLVAVGETHMSRAEARPGVAGNGAMTDGAGLGLGLGLALGLFRSVRSRPGLSHAALALTEAGDPSPARRPRRDGDVAGLDRVRRRTVETHPSGADPGPVSSRAVVEPVPCLRTVTLGHPRPSAAAIPRRGAEAAAGV